jgi:hypothetical protein
MRNEAAYVPNTHNMYASVDYRFCAVKVGRIAWGRWTEGHISAVLAIHGELPAGEI